MAPQTVWTVFAATVARFGKRVAIEVQRPDRVDRFTYQQLYDLAVAHGVWLAANGVQPGDRCAILAHNDAHWCAVYLGILRAGATAVPLDTNYSAKQVATIVKDSGARLLFVSERLRPVVAEALNDELINPQIDIADVHSSPGTSTALSPEAQYPPSAPAVILYTSGTTSDPKGVVLTHANLLAERDAAFKVVTVTDQDALLGVLPLFHSLAQLANLLLPFAAGARVVYLETINSTDLVRALKERQITIFCCVPQFFYLIHQRVMQQVQKSGLLTRVVFRMLLALNFRLRRMGLNLGPVLFGKVHDVMGRKMRLLVTGGSKFDPAIGRDLYSLGFTILQAYGLTETSAAASINTVDEAHIDTVGRPLPGNEIKILPPEAEGGDGEIAIRGPIVMAGYYNRPDATARVMRDGWFLTGDLGRMDAEGRLQITGRKKEMIVLASGKNIYPEEIEAHYRQSPYVKEICVMGLAEAGRPSTERLFAAVVPDLDLMRERKIVNAGDILRFEIEGLAVGLPAHKRVLGYDVWFEPLPRTTTQKIKRHEVERRVRERQLAATADVSAPLSDQHQAWLEDAHARAAAAVIQARLRGGVRLRPDANLELDLGLDSMERVELLTELEHRFQVKVPQAATHEIFTVQQLVEAVRPGSGDDKPEGLSPRGPAVTGGDHPVGGDKPGVTGGDKPLGLSTADESWSVLLRDLPPVTDPVLGGLLERRPLATPLLFVLCRIARMLLGRTRVTGLDKLPTGGAFIICPNHQSFVDPLFVSGSLPYRVWRALFYVGAVEYFETPFTRWVARTINLVPVDADSNLVPAMKAGAFGLSHGKVLVLFPEGERSIDGTVKKFKKGAPILAQHLGVPIVPVTIKGVYEIWPRNRPFNWRLLLPFSGHRVTIAFGEPMRFDEKANYADSTAQLRERVAGMGAGKSESGDLVMS
ncbi:MAG: AMP-binding protein [Acidobacteriota bacterium]|nr:AMP-binding protein [Acidobacteriota bacterium]